MKRKLNFQKIIFIIVLFFVPILVLTSPACADGKLFVRHPLTSQWQLQEMNKQLCAIHYENGFQNMLLSIYVNDLQGEEGVWIFPVPAKPDEAAIDIFKSFPIFYGRDIEKEFGNLTNHIFRIIRGTQIYTLPFEATFLFWRLGLQGRLRGVDVHDRIEKMGLTTELITAKDAVQLADYLKDKALDLPVDQKSVLEEYIGKEYSFVVSWISNIEEFKEQASKTGYGTDLFHSLSVFITFPTDKICFPLRLTSVYGSTRIPMTVFVTGHVTPELYSGIKNNSQISYYIESDYHVSEELKPFFNGRARMENLKYTKIEIDSPSKYLSSDLWINAKAPRKIAFVDFIIQHRYALGVLLFALLSCLSSLLAGTIAFRRYQPQQGKFALFGLWNFLTLIGLTIAAYRFKVDDQLTQKKESLQLRLSSKKIIKRTLLFPSMLCVLFFSSMFLIFGFYNFDVAIFALSLTIGFLISVIFIFPFVYVFSHNKYVRNYILLFTVFFILMTTLVQLGLYRIFGI